MYHLGLDIGSSSIKASLVEVATGKAVAVVSEPDTEMGMEAKQNGWAEQDPDLWWELSCKAIKRVLKENAIAPSRVVGIGIAYQMHGLVVVDKQGNPIRPSIIWCDSRAVEIGEKAYGELGEETCGLHYLNSPGNFTASKLKWVMENEPESYARIHKFMLPGDFIAYKFSGKINTTISGLSEGILWDFKNDRLATDLLHYYGISEELVPKIVPTFSIQSKVSAQGAVDSGLLEGTPILYRAGDQPNNALSLNVMHPGDVAATGGTSGVVYAVTDNLSVNECAKVNNFAHVNYSKSNPNIGKLLCINGSGILYRWLLNNLKANSYQEMNQMASSVAVGSEGALIIPFGNGAERVLNNTNMGAQFSNINLNIHSAAHIYRAALEGIAFSFIYGMEIMESDGVHPKAIKAGDDNLFRASIFAITIATLLDVEIKIYHTTGAIGAARACSLLGGDATAFEKQLETNDYIMSYQPAQDKEPYKKAYENWKTELQYKLNKQ